LNVRTICHEILQNAQKYVSSGRKSMDIRFRLTSSIQNTNGIAKVAAANLHIAGIYGSQTCR
jgi:hypothetical protein